MENELKLLTGNSNPELVKLISKHLNIPLVSADVTTFSDGEIQVEIKENIRGSDVFLIQSLCRPVNHNLMELLVMIDAVKRASAQRITVVVPYYAYARQDRKVTPRAPISAKLIADLLTTAGTYRILTVDLHAGQIQGFFNIPVDNLFATPVLIKYLRGRFSGESAVIVSPDAGGVERARAFAKRLGMSLAIIDKRRDEPNIAKAMNIIGDIKGKTAILVDDMIDTGGSIIQAAESILDKEGDKVYAVATHPVFSGPAIDKIKDSHLSEVVVTDTIPLEEKARSYEKFKVLSISELLAQAIHRINHNDSVSSLFI